MPKIPTLSGLTEKSADVAGMLNKFKNIISSVTAGAASVPVEIPANTHPLQAKVIELNAIIRECKEAQDAQNRLVLALQDKVNDLASQVSSYLTASAPVSEAEKLTNSDSAVTSENKSLDT